MPLPVRRDPEPPPTVARSRQLAAATLRDLHSNDPNIARAAAERFCRLRSFAGSTPDQLLAEPARVRRKHALALIAEKHAFPSWLCLKQTADLLQDAPPMYAPRLTLFLNRWFAEHGEARASLAREGGWLLPFRRQFFVTERGGIVELGLDPDDPDWQRIGHDFARPADAAAWSRLAARRWQAIALGAEAAAR